MGERTAIQWTDHTWNPWHGCAKVSAGCKFCYMFRDKERYGQDPTAIVRASPATFNAPIARHGARSTKGTPGDWKWMGFADEGELRGGRRVLTRRNRVFTCSWSDWFIEEADMWRPDAWDIVRQRPDLTFQILTKRPERIRESLPRDWGAGWENVWLGVSVENQKAGKTRIPLLAKVPARVRFLSVEPLLERVTPLFWPLQSLSWVIVGGESGSATESRACEVQWVRDVVRQCKDIGVPVFVKQLGSSWARDTRCPDTHGGDPNYWPVDLRVREFPETIDATR